MSYGVAMHLCCNLPGQTQTEETNSSSYRGAHPNNQFNAATEDAKDTSYYLTDHH